MKHAVEINPRLWAGPQPTEADLRQLARRRFRAIIDLRTAQEDWLPTERYVAEACGLIYRHLPVSTDNITRQTLASFRDAVERLPGPIYVHCRMGERATTLPLLAECDETDPGRLLPQLGDRRTPATQGAYVSPLARVS